MGRQTQRHSKLVERQKKLKEFKKRKHLYSRRAFLVRNNNFNETCKRFGLGGGCILRYPKVTKLLEEKPMEKPTDSIDILNFTYVS